MAHFSESFTDSILEDSRAEDPNGNEARSDGSHEGDSDEEDAARRAARQERERKVRIILIDPENVVVDVWIRRNSPLSKVRSLVAGRVRVPTREVNLKYDGALLTEERSKPLLQLGNEITLHWFREVRLLVLLRVKGLRDLNSVGRWDRNVLHYATMDRDYEMLREVLSRRGFNLQLINAPDVFLDTPIMLASTRGDEDIMQMLIEREANVHCENLYGRTPLMQAAEHGHSEAVTNLLEANASLQVGSKSRVGKTTPHALHLAMLNGQEGVALAIKAYQQRQKQLQENQKREKERQKALQQRSKQAEQGELGLADEPLTEEAFQDVPA